jgi:hypothetical protein
MQDNKDLQKPAYVLKADMALADLTSGGKLVADQFKKFYLVAIKGQRVMSLIRNAVLKRETTEIPRMTTFGSQVLHPGTESQALTLGQRVAPGFGKTTITSTEVVAQVDYPKYALMDQVEMQGFKSTLLAYLAIHVKRDLENLIINGNTGSANTLLALFNGMLQGASSNTYPAGGVTLATSVLGNTRKTMPSEYKVQPNMVYLTNEFAFEDLWTEYESRIGTLGDSKLIQGATSLPFRGQPLYEVPLFPDNLGLGLTETAVWYGDPKQFIFGLHENLETWTEYNGRERTWTVVLTMRLGQGYDYEPAVVKTTGVTGQ